MPRVAVRRRFKHKKDHEKAKKVREKKQQSLGESSKECAGNESGETGETTDSECGSRPPSVASSAAESVNLNIEEDSMDALSPDPSIVSPTSSTIIRSSVSSNKPSTSSSIPASPLMATDSEDHNSSRDFRSPSPSSRHSCSSGGHTPTSEFKVPLITPDNFLRSSSPQGSAQPELLKEVKSRVEMFLKDYCICYIQNECIYILFLSRTEDKITQRQLCFRSDGSVSFRVHCKPYDIQHHLKNFLKPKNLNSSSVKHFVDRMAQIIQLVTEFEICAGVSDIEYQAVWASCDRGKIDDNPFKECRYTETFRSLKCDMLVYPRKWKCAECCRLVGVLKRKCDMSKKEKLHPHTPNVLMTEQQKLKKLEDQRNEIVNTKRQLQRAKMQQLIAAEGMDLEENFSSYLQDVLRSQKLTPLQSLFLQQQLMAINAKGPTGRRWHPVIIRFALSIITKSPSSYGAMVKGGLLLMPCARTLFDYAHFKPTQDGVDYEIVDAVSKRLQKIIESGENYQKYHVLMCDEIHISKNLVYNKETGKILGYINISDVDAELEQLQDYLENPESKSESKENPVASKTLTFLIKGVANDVKEAVASFAVDVLTKEQLYRWSWEVIIKLERAGIAVIAFTSDGSAINRAFIKMNKPATEGCEVTFDTINKAAPERLMYFIADVPHLIKTIRNSFYSSSEKRYMNKRTGKMMLRRRLEKNGEKIVWSTIVKLYNYEKDKTLKLAYKLNVQNVFLNGYSKMKVKHAAQVLSRTVALLLEQLNWENTKETIDFIRRVNDFFDMLNGAHTSQGARTLNKNLEPYTSQDDERFAALEDFLSYLSEWKAEAEQVAAGHVTIDRSSNDVFNEQMSVMEDIDEEGPDEGNDPAAIRQLSYQTLEGIHIAIKGFTGAVRFLLNEGTKYVNARVFCQDPLEQFFSKLRQRGGGSTNPNFSQVLQGQRAIHLQGKVGTKRNYRGNTEEAEEEMDINLEPLPKRVSASRAAAKQKKKS